MMQQQGPELGQLKQNLWEFGEAVAAEIDDTQLGAAGELFRKVAEEVSAGVEHAQGGELCNAVEGGEAGGGDGQDGQAGKVGGGEGEAGGARAEVRRVGVRAQGRADGADPGVAQRLQAAHAGAHQGRVGGVRVGLRQRDGVRQGQLRQNQEAEVGREVGPGGHGGVREGGAWRRDAAGGF